MILSTQLTWLRDKRGVFVVKFDSINDIFVSRFSELALLFEELYSLWKNEAIPPHCFIGGVLNSYTTVSFPFFCTRNSNSSEKCSKIKGFQQNSY